MLGQLIPQVFYDVIGRLVPGLVLIGTCFLIWRQTVADLLAGVAPFSTPGLAALVIAAYVLALVLEGGWNLSLGRWTGRLHQRGGRLAAAHAKRDFKTMVPDFDPEAFEFPGIPIVYDAVRLRDPAVGSNIVKLRAEVQLCRTLLLGWLLALAGLGIDAALHGARAEKGFIAVALALSIVAIFSLYRERQTRVLWSLYNHWLLLIQPGSPRIDRKTKDEDRSRPA
jgi:hypothetical protein